MLQYRQNSPMGFSWTIKSSQPNLVDSTTATQSTSSPLVLLPVLQQHLVLWVGPMVWLADGVGRWLVRSGKTTFWRFHSKRCSSQRVPPKQKKYKIVCINVCQESNLKPVPKVCWKLYDCMEQSHWKRIYKKKHVGETVGKHDIMSSAEFRVP